MKCLKDSEIKSALSYWLDELIRTPAGEVGTWETVRDNLKMSGIEVPGDWTCKSCPVAIFLSEVMEMQIRVSNLFTYSNGNLFAYSNETAVSLPIQIKDFIAWNDNKSKAF